MFKAITLSLILGLSSYGITQIGHYEKCRQSVKTVVDGYNQQDFGLMQKPWGLIGKVLISNKMLRKEFQPFFNKYGVAVIDTIGFNSIYTGTAQLKFKSHPKKRAFLTFNFNEKGKVQGLGFGYPIYIYRNENIPKNSLLSADEKRERIDSIVSQYSKNLAPNDFNGCIMVTDGSEILYKTCLGYSDYDRQTPNNDTTAFLLASCTKQFTAVAIIQLQEQGKLNYDDMVQMHLPEFPYENISIENLLTHTSGLPDYMSLLKANWDKTKFAENKDVLALLNKHKPKLMFNPNEHFRYSNTGYVILSLLIEKVSGVSYNDYLIAHFFKPLNMKHTYVYHRRAQNDTLNNYAKGYIFSKEHNKYILPDSLARYQYVTYMDKITGDDGVSSCILDLKLWNEALNNYTLISQKSTDLAYAKHLLNDGDESDYGYGLILKKGDGIEDIIFHTGSWPGYSTMIFRFAERDESIVVLSNNAYAHYDFLVDEICTILLK